MDFNTAQKVSNRHTLLIGLKVFVLTICQGFLFCFVLNYSWFIILHILVSSIQHYDSVSVFLIIIHYTLLQDIIYNSLCNILNPCCSSVFCIAVCISYLICSLPFPSLLKYQNRRSEQGSFPEAEVLCPPRYKAKGSLLRLRWSLPVT